MQFKDIEGQYDIANQLTEIIDSGRISHAQMFLGKTVSGNLALAIAYAQYVSCEHRCHYGDAAEGGLRADSCGECASCKKYKQLSHPDVHFYFPNTTNDRVKKDASSSEFASEFREFLLANHQQATLDDWYSFFSASITLMRFKSLVSISSSELN